MLRSILGAMTALAFTLLIGTGLAKAQEIDPQALELSRKICALINVPYRQ
jgi:hypothetical protein